MAAQVHHHSRTCTWLFRRCAFYVSPSLAFARPAPSSVCSEVSANPFARRSSNPFRSRGSVPESVSSRPPESASGGVSGASVSLLSTPKYPTLTSERLRAATASARPPCQALEAVEEVSANEAEAAGAGAGVAAGGAAAPAAGGAAAPAAGVAAAPAAGVAAAPAADDGDSAAPLSAHAAGVTSRSAAAVGAEPPKQGTMEGPLRPRASLLDDQVSVLQCVTWCCSFRVECACCKCGQQ